MVDKPELVKSVIGALTQLLDDPEFYRKIVNHVDQSRKTFGSGCVLIDVSPFLAFDNCVSLEDIFGFEKSDNELSALWLDKEITYKILAQDIADQLWTEVDVCLSECKQNQFVALPMAIVDQGDGVPNRYATAMQVVICDKPATQPSRISESQIEKRLRRSLGRGTRLVLLDTSTPDCMGRNLAKWLRVITKLQRQGKHLSVMIDSSPEFPAEIPPELQGDCLQVAFK